MDWLRKKIKQASSLHLWAGVLPSQQTGPGLPAGSSTADPRPSTQHGASQHHSAAPAPNSSYLLPQKRRHRYCTPEHSSRGLPISHFGQLLGTCAGDHLPGATALDSPMLAPTPASGSFQNLPGLHPAPSTQSQRICSYTHREGNRGHQPLQGCLQGGLAVTPTVTT